MAESYPLVEQREYGRPQQGGGWFHKRPVRGEDDLPLLAAHEVRIFRVGEEYIEDHGGLRPDDPVVVAASSVTVVDRSVGVPVVVEMRIPSAEAGDFTVRTTFHCTVADARTVVRDGVTDVEALLLDYLRAVPGLTEQGGDLPIVDSAVVRRRIDARLTAYQEMRPHVFSGLKAYPRAVEVLSPEELAAHVREVEETRRAREKDRLREQLERERALALAEKEREREEIRREEALRKERNRQEYETLRTRYDHVVSAEDQEHELMLKGRQNGFVRNEMTEDLRLIGNDPIAADFNAYRNGDISADTLADRLRAAEARRADRADALTKLEQEYLERRATLERDDQRWQVERDDKRKELERADRLEEHAAGREAESRRWEQERDDKLREHQERRQDAQRLSQEQREWAERRLVVNHDIGKRLIDRGLVDNTIVDPGAFINSVGEIPQYGPQALGQAPAPQKASAERLDKRPADTDVVDGEADHESDKETDPDPESGDDSDLDLGTGDMEAHIGH
ncbi:OmpH family outer membrane protein [Streptomyces sp. NBC_00035]|uniref:OmpH family outer membrane protein n=1 Tax=Streptomyces sp. NBC_00035 TaxID=2903614 RepID=UPI00324D080E